MKTQATLLLSALATLLLAACSTTAPQGTARTKPYPLKTCIVTDNDLYSMGTPSARVYNGQEIKVCCRPCIAEFEKSPAKYLAKLP